MASNVGKFGDWTSRASRSGGCEECSKVSFPLHPLSCYALNKMRYTDEVRGAYTEKLVHQNGGFLFLVTTRLL